MILCHFIYVCGKFHTDTMNQTVIGKEFVKLVCAKRKTISSHLNFSLVLSGVVEWVSREFTKPRRQRQRERHRTKDLMARTMAVHMRFNSWYISLRSSTKQQRDMTKSCVVWRT